jgi:hypothetical protein
MRFRSKLERDVADLLNKFNVDFEYESLKVPYVISHNYNPDFQLANGINLEIKGFFDADDRRKMKAVKEQNPELDVRLVFQNPLLKISKRSKTSYAQWAEQNGIKWCSYKKIPLDWLCSQQEHFPQSND